ncbi:hypothetical protein OG592_43255 (plasmid) [Streptomyces avidinii]|uniref:hypothetical protein n=1 Tax=Streptomyces avidinii TaxID=1895 RepID=UPI003865BC1A|nr:hypothetical protein OG592_43255 [Streptomyces avidinii]
MTPARGARAARQTGEARRAASTGTHRVHRAHPTGAEDGEAHARVWRVEELRRQLAGVLSAIDAVLLPQELGEAVTGARQWLEAITPANPLSPAPAFVRALEHTVRITQQLLARHTVAATYVHLDTEQPPWAEHERLEAASAQYCRHVAVRQHDVATHGWPLDQRPGFARLRGDIEEGRVQLLVVRSAADLSPSSTPLADLEQEAEAITAWLLRHRTRLLCTDQIAPPLFIP